jgi:VanZ family protein
MHKPDMNKTADRRLVVAAAWASIIFIAYATLTHVGFVYSIYYKLAPFLMQPEIRNYAHIEHVLVFAIAGALFSFAYPRRTLLVCLIIFGSAGILEILQTMTPDRHGHIIDALEKMAGGAVGIFLSKSFLQIGQPSQTP